MVLKCQSEGDDTQNNELELSQRADDRIKNVRTEHLIPMMEDKYKDL